MTVGRQGASHSRIGRYGLNPQGGVGGLPAQSLIAMGRIVQG
jgi:hypothetical protein